jgi:hypothetical protein
MFYESLEVLTTVSDHRVVPNWGSGGVFRLPTKVVQTAPKNHWQEDNRKVRLPDVKCLHSSADRLVDYTPSSLPHIPTAEWLLERTDGGGCCSVRDKYWSGRSPSAGTNSNLCESSVTYKR